MKFRGIKPGECFVHVNKPGFEFMKIKRIEVNYLGAKHERNAVVTASHNIDLAPGTLTYFANCEQVERT